MTGSMLIVMGLVGLMVSQLALAVNFYRYENDDGRKVPRRIR